MNPETLESFLFQVSSISDGIITATEIKKGEVTIRTPYIDEQERFTVGEWYFVDYVQDQFSCYAIVNEATVSHRSNDNGEVDDWIFNPKKTDLVSRKLGLQTTATPSFNPISETKSRNLNSSSVRRFQSHSKPTKTADVDTVTKPDTANDSVGAAVGGAADIDSFRQKIRNGVLPTKDDITVEGLFYDYYFGGVGSDEDPPESAFYPSWSYVAATSPTEQGVEEYIPVSLESNLSFEQANQDPLDLVCVIDVSGSMEATFKDDGESKIDAVKKTLKKMTEQLDDEERLGVVLYSGDSHIAKPLRQVGETDMDAIREHIDELYPMGSTNLSAGFKAGKEMLSDRADGRKQRIILMTDQRPNRGLTNEHQLIQMISDAATEEVYTSFIGVGLDAQTELSNKLSQVRGANYRFISSSEEFTERLANEFDYLTTPLAFDLSLEIESDAYDVIDAYGVPSTSSELLHVETLYPSPANEDGSKGSMILVKVEKTGSQDTVSLKASWTDANTGENKSDVINAQLGQTELDEYPSDAVKKSVALVQYFDVLTNWIETKRDAERPPRNPLQVSSEEHRQTLRDMQNRLEELSHTVDESLEQEVNLISELIEN